MPTIATQRCRCPSPLGRRQGHGTDVQFPLFAHEQANTDMLAVLRGREMPEPPPSDMAQPVRLKLTLSAKSKDGD